MTGTDADALVVGGVQNGLVWAAYLSLTGASTYPGAGIWGASGRNAAHVVMGAISGPARPR